MYMHYFRNRLPPFKKVSGSRALVAVGSPASVESQEGYGTRTAILVSMALLVALIVVVAETCLDNLRGHAVAPAASRSK